jgi:hypothetical protein
MTTRPMLSRFAPRSTAYIPERSLSRIGPQQKMK